MNSPTPAAIVAHVWAPLYSNAHVLFSPVDFVREVYARFARRDSAGVFELLSPDVEIVQTTTLPWRGRYRGLRGAREFFLRLNRYADGTFEPLRYLPAGNDVAVIGRHRGTARETGRTFDVDLVHVWTIRDGKVTRCLAFVDTPTIQVALGIA